MFKKHNFEIFLWNPNDPNLDLFKFLGKINLNVSELHKKMQQIKQITRLLIKLLRTLKK